MSTPLITWGCIVALFAIVFLIRFYRACKSCAKGKSRLIEIGAEREEFFIPGDPDLKCLNDYDCEQFD